ncbi:plasmid partition protein ParG [Siccibacter colletis]|uniref:plasmid partition protein ParG n=1 Tax=Siccibacter colletis TaxID=1505757 RepID=UPI003CEA3B62
MEITPALHRKFKAVCTLKGVSMSDVMNKAIEAWLSRNAGPWVDEIEEETTE